MFRLRMFEASTCTTTHQGVSTPNSQTVSWHRKRARPRHVPTPNTTQLPHLPLKRLPLTTNGLLRTHVALSFPVERDTIDRPQEPHTSAFTTRATPPLPSTSTATYYPSNSAPAPRTPKSPLRPQNGQRRLYTPITPPNAAQNPAP
ncbi:hypothetical protein PLEOSDRAFT_1102780 [Pleurotus ostreatus PC15]|uniref:Uncharacterized protein n=1 Tax=Pleurotus ostreatus (strain PC15) TaxID=1137138 RepID=A0A067NP05_PLEO1|nr:hypothetical protein PLEOSDRAFT_1102780 [Pleurotus ostreatus PC15]